MSAPAGWKEHDGALEKTFVFADYYRVMAFVNAAAYLAHRDDHHPDLGVHYNRVCVRYTSHDAGKVTARDHAAAAKLDALL